MKEQFLSNNTSWIAWEELKQLKHDKTIHEYFKSFSSLILHIENILKEDKLLIIY